MNAAKHPARWLAPLIAAQLLWLAPLAQAQVAGEVEFSRGVGFAQTPGQAPRTLGKGLPLREGDRLTTSDGASAVIKLQDGTKMTVRPNSELVLQQYQFKEAQPEQNSMLMQLVRGGFRAVTGAIAKGSPNAARVQTNTATIGIRGTDFDARLCRGAECAQESARIQETARPNAPLASGKVATSAGEIHATNAAGERRRVVDGGSIYPGDMIETARGAHAVIAFRDESRVTLGSQTRFRVDNFVFDDKNAGDGRFLASVLRGSVRALTGLIAKSNNRNVGFSTATATIGIRGTGLDVRCTGPCAFPPEPPTGPDDGFSLWTWLGSTTLQQLDANGQPINLLQVLQANQGFFIPANGGPIVPISSQPNPPGQGPLPTDVPGQVIDKLFARDNQPADSQEGLFVFVRDGHIEIAGLHLGRGEAGFVGTGGDSSRPPTIPKFLDFDQIPLPNSKNPLLTSILGEAGLKTSKQCVQ